MDEIDLFSLIVAGGCHDHEHPGFNNVYLTETKDPIATRYNGNHLVNQLILDQSVLENHHIASSFAVMQSDPKYDILDKFKKDDFKRARSLMIGSVLATDMSKHFGECSKFKTRTGADDYDVTKGMDKDLTMYMLFHLADISNTTKPWDVCKMWIDLLFVEFFNQGDLERQRGSPISYLMDRCTVNIAKS
jgi:hypothetical protein